MIAYISVGKDTSAITSDSTINEIIREKFRVPEADGTIMEIGNNKLIRWQNIFTLSDVDIYYRSDEQTDYILLPSNSYIDFDGTLKEIEEHDVSDYEF